MELKHHQFTEPDDPPEQIAVETALATLDRLADEIGDHCADPERFPHVKANHERLVWSLVRLNNLAHYVGSVVK